VTKESFLTAKSRAGIRILISMNVSDEEAKGRVHPEEGKRKLDSEGKEEQLTGSPYFSDGRYENVSWVGKEIPSKKIR